LLDNPVDVDKLAYLIDDSAFSGLPFGLAVAPGPVFEAMRVPDATHWRALPKDQKIAVAVREKALSYVEQSVLSRYWNIQTGYWYRTNRSLQAMVKFQIASLLQANALQFNEFVLETLHLSANGAMRWLNDKFKAAIRTNGIDRDTVNPIEGLLLSRRDIYRRLVTISPRSEVDERTNDRFIHEGLRARNPLEDSDICDKTSAVLQLVLPSLKVRPGEVLLDLQRVRREDLDGKILVYSDSPGATYLGELSKISPVLRGLEQQFDFYAKRLRIFIHPRLQEDLAAAGLQEKAHEATLDMLRSEFPKK